MPSCFQISDDESLKAVNRGDDDRKIRRSNLSAAANAFSWCVGRPFLAAYSSAASSNVRSGRKRMLIRARFSPATDLLRTLRVTSRSLCSPTQQPGCTCRNFYI